jgi:cell division protein FtsI (penicillin-binding protein 3)
MRFRFFLAVLGFFLAFGVILIQAYRIQILHGAKLREQAKGMYQRQITLVPTRGRIFDRNGEDLAITIPVDSIYARPEKIEDPVATARLLAPILDLDKSSLVEKLRGRRPFVWIKRQVVPIKSAGVRKLGQPGLGVIREARRFYPNLELGCHVLGIVGVDGEGLEGLELAYNGELRGEKSRITVERDAIGTILPRENGLIVARRNGHHLMLTIHKEIQHVAEQHLEAAVRATGSKKGMVVVLSPSTGEVLAMANVPRFNPNIYAEYHEAVRRNRCVTHPYEPGSIIKPLLVGAAIEEGVLKPMDIIFCENGSYRILDKTIHDVGRHGWLSLRKIIQRSSNIGAAKVGLSLGAEKLYSYYDRFGLGRLTGIDYPGEAPGIMRPSRMWSRLELATISFGQGISSTALQLAAAFASVANEGGLMKPYLVKEILDAEGNTVEQRRPACIGQVISPKTAQQITKMLMDVVSENGTGYRAAVDGYRVAGKTGTAQKADLRAGGYQPGRYVASFVGYVPAEDPSLCILIMLEEPQGNVLGGQVAAPVFREIARDSLGILGIYPDRRLLAMGPN